jgi:hypothetical protein
MKQTEYHSEWQNSRIKFILDLYEPEFFKSKKILELGAYNGYIGNYFAEVLGAEVTSVEGRQQNVSRMKEDYPLLNVECCDLDTDEWNFGKHDIIINFGLFYHLEKYHEQHLINCINNSRLMFFETVIHDSYESEIFFRTENGGDQSLTCRGGAPSTSYVENIFKKVNCKYKKYTDSKLNGGPHHYDWEDKDTRVEDQFARRFWIVENEINSTSGQS